MVPGMATTGIDRWLKGLEDMTELDADDLDQRLAALKAEAEVLQLKIFVLEPLLERARKRDSRRRTIEPPQAESADEASNGSAPKVHAPTTWKRDAVLELLASRPHEMFAPVEVRNTLRSMGVLEDDEGTPMPVLLRRLADRHQVHVENGKYGFKGPDGVARFGWTGRE